MPEGSTTRVGGAAPGCFPFGPASGRFGSYEKAVRVCKVSKLSKAFPAVGQPENVRSVRVVAWHRAARGVAPRGEAEGEESRAIRHPSHPDRRAGSGVRKVIKFGTGSEFLGAFTHLPLPGIRAVNGGAGGVGR